MFVIRQKRQLLQTIQRSGGKAVQSTMPIQATKPICQKIAAMGVALVLLLSSSVAYAVGTIQQVRVGQDSQKTRIVFDLKDKTKFQVRMLNNPSRVMVVFNHAQNNISFNDKTFHDSRLYKMLVHEQGEQTRVTMQLHRTLDISSFHLAENAQGFNRLVIDLKDVAEVQKVRAPVAQTNEATLSQKNGLPSGDELQAKSVQQESAKVETPTAELGAAQKATKVVTTEKQPESEQIKPDEESIVEEAAQEAEQPQDAIDKSVDILLATKLPKAVITEQAVKPQEANTEQASAAQSESKEMSAESKQQAESAKAAESKQAPQIVAQQGVMPQPENDANQQNVEATEIAKAEIKDSLQKLVPPLINQEHELVIALDAGHGGKDPGAVNRQTRIMEKDVTLQMAKQLKRQIDAQPNMRAVLIREKDVFIPLYERQKIAKRKGADIFISIHADAFKDERVHGGSVYVLSRRGASSHMARLLAKSENAYLQDVKLSGFDDDVAYALSDLSRRSNIEHSQKLAKSVLAEMDKKMTMHRAQVQSAQFAVLKAIDMPSMLIETAFISNPNEARNLVNPLFQKKMANAIVAGLSRYIEEHRQSPAQTPNTLFVRYKVKSGDNLTMIAKKFNVSVSKIKHHNQIRNANRLYVGKRLRIPVSQDLLAKIDQIS